MFRVPFRDGGINFAKQYYSRSIKRGIKPEACYSRHCNRRFEMNIISYIEPAVNCGSDIMYNVSQRQKWKDL